MFYVPLNLNKPTHTYSVLFTGFVILYGSKTRGPEDDSVESKHVALISHYMFNITTVVFD